MKKRPVKDTYVHLCDRNEMKVSWSEGSGSLGRDFVLKSYSIEIKKLLFVLFFACSVYALQAQDVTINESWNFSLDQKEWTIVNIPHTWNVEDAHDDDRGYFTGDGWYKKQIYIPRTDRNKIFLHFEGAYLTTTVSVNGKEVGSHKGGYTGFVVDITEAVTWDAQNEILIKVSNAYDANIPPRAMDFSFYGGIYRDLWLVRKASPHFNLLDLSTKGVYLSQKTTPEQATLIAKSNILSDKRKNVTLSVQIYDPSFKEVSLSSKQVKLVEGENTITISTDILRPQLWSPDTPNLYTVEVNLLDPRSDEMLDSFTGKVGFRWFEMNEDGAFLLNGEKIKLIGASRHQDFDGLGSALPDNVHRRDMEILKEMGGNFVRLAHYPHDPAVLEACDELGIIVWEEIPMATFISLNDAFKMNSKTMMVEMIRQLYNHSSIVMWGFMNEILLNPGRAYGENEGLDEETYYAAVHELLVQLDSVTRAEDPNRFTSVAHHANYEKYKKADLIEAPDVVAWNIYSGWYGDDPLWSRAGEYLDEFHDKHPDKGTLISEYGAGADPRVHAIAPRRFDFSIEWQTIYHANYLKQVMGRDHVMGAAVWNLADFGAEHRVDAVPRINSKGLITYDREPKDAYVFYQAALSENPFLKIGNTHWRKRKGISGNDKLPQPIHVFTNLDQVEIIHNGESLGPFKVENFQVKTDISFINGQNQIIVKSGELIDLAYYNVEIISKNLKEMLFQNIDISMNVGSHVYFHHPASDVMWIPERAYEEGSMGYVDGSRLESWKVGVGDEIFGSDLEPVYQTHRDSISTFKMDVPNGTYEVTLHFAELYSQEKREKLAYNLGSDAGSQEVSADRDFSVVINNEEPLALNDLKEFFGVALKQKIVVNDGAGITISFETNGGSAFLSGVEVRGY